MTSDGSSEPSPAPDGVALSPTLPIVATVAALHEVAAQWDRAEALIKQAERLRGEVVHPSINELRYAGRRLVDAWKLLPADDAAVFADFQNFVSDAKFRCHCAQHDAVDASIIFVERALKQYETEFGHVLLLQYFPQVADLRQSLHEAGAVVVASRADRGRRAEEYERLSNDHLPNIIRIFLTISSNREALEAIVAEASKRETKDTRRFKWTNGFAVIAALAGAVLGVVGTERYEMWRDAHHPKVEQHAAPLNGATKASSANDEKPSTKKAP